MIPKTWLSVRKILLSILSIMFVAVLALYLGVVVGAIGVTLPKPTGPYAVGRATYDMVDPFRSETFVDDANTLRSIVATVYYPAQPPHGTKPAPYTEGKMAQLLAAQVHLPAITAKLIHSHAYLDVPLAEGKSPVVLFLPGIGTPPLEYTSSAEDLASHGYVVAMLYPTYSVPVTVFSDGRVEMMNDAGLRSEKEPPGTSEEQTDKDRDAIGSVWVADARFALDQLSKLNRDDPLLKDHLDLERVGIYGHSFGGATAAEALKIDGRFSAGINMDGKAFGMTDSTRIERPFMWMASDYSNVTDGQLAQIHMSRTEFNEKISKRVNEREDFLRPLPEGHLFILKGSTHGTFVTDEAFLGGLIPGMKDKLASIDGSRASMVSHTYVSTFFDYYLKKRSTELLDGNSAEWPDVEMMVIRRAALPR